MSTTIDDPGLVEERPGLAGIWDGWRRRLAQGEIGQLPVIIGLIAIGTIFTILSNGTFLKPSNLTNLFLQIAAVGTIAAGIVLVLLLGEIDLSAGALSGLAAGVVAVLNVNMGIPSLVAISLGILTGTAVGAIQGSWTFSFRIPSFVVTLAGMLAWTGALLFILGKTGAINIKDPLILGLAGTFYSGAIGWILGLVFVAGFAVYVFWGRRQRAAAGLLVGSALTTYLRIAVIVVLVLAAIAILNQDRGIPASLLIMIGLIVVLDLVLRRTRFGRYVMAIGGGAEAARRAGINITNVRIAIFALCSSIAAFGGILGLSRANAVYQATGGGDLLLNAIAAAVIGGTSLFGGRGTVWAALLGALVIGSIANGMALLSLEPSVQYMITGAVLLAAVTIDAIARRGRQASGRA